MEDEKDRFGEKMRLLERAKEDIYFAEKDRELIEKLKARLRKVEKTEGAGSPLRCPKCQGNWETYTFMGFVLERCTGCEGIWLDKGELEGVLKKVTQGPLAALIEKFIGHK
ncbi:MAG TPA: zf-TFIIB domain-containing protein [Candidatus Binatia bacterium]|jgi:hypothetical protein|nr:zf-TFIIB domain-containing protein [Candidatus Binatia bacterium]